MCGPSRSAIFYPTLVSPAPTSVAKRVRDEEGVCSVPDGVTGAKTDPLGNGAVLPLRLGELLLRAESLVALCQWGSVWDLIMTVSPLQELHSAHDPVGCENALLGQGARKRRET